MKKGDLVVVMNGWDSLLGIGKVSQCQYEYRKELSATPPIFFDHVRQVKWELAQNYNRRILLPVRLTGFNNTLRRIDINTRFWTILSDLDIS
jgi:hypothetical protein